MLTPQQELLLRGSPTLPVGLYQLQLATAGQLTRIHYRAGTLKTVKARLKQLVDAGYLVADTVPTRLFRSPYYYLLTEKAFRYLAGQGLDTGEVSRPSGQHGTLFIDHSLELNDVLISAALLFKATPTCYLDSFTHEQVLKRKPYKGEAARRPDVHHRSGCLPGLPHYPAEALESADPFGT
jgi:Replication-relaxation